VRKLLVSTLVSLVLVAPVRAQGPLQLVVSPTPPDLATPAPDADQQQKDNGTQLVEDALRARLARAGFTDIEVMATSFLVQAKDADGNPVMLMFSPDPAAHGRQAAPQDSQDHAAGGATVPGEEKF
jgi:hypothetical protein